MKHIIITALLFTAAVTARAQPDNCPRGIAVPILKRSAYPETTFRIGKDERTGTETVDLARGERLIVKNYGCEYYVLMFRFETTHGRRTNDLEYWFRQAVRRMDDIYPGIEAPIDIKKGVRKLESHIDTQRKAKIRKLILGEEIMFGGDEQDPNGDDIPQTVSVNKIQKLKNHRFALEITFAAGPL